VSKWETPAFILRNVKHPQFYYYTEQECVALGHVMWDGYGRIWSPVKEERMLTIYLAGPIQGKTDIECKGWRDEIKDIYGLSYKLLDPMDRDYRGREDRCFREIVENDKRDIMRSDILLVNWTMPGTAGTAMEIHFAHLLKIPVVVFVNEGDKISPWIKYHSKAITTSRTGAMEYIRKQKYV